MNESARGILKCQDPGDGTGDVIIDLPDDIVESMGLNPDDLLSIELVDGAIVLTPVRDSYFQP